LAESLAAERRVIEQYRRANQEPLTLVAANLRYFVRKHAGEEPIVLGQRLKEFPSIVLKIRREPTMRLSQMQDVGGCRAVVLRQGTAYDIAEDLTRQRRWDVVDVDDYVVRPQSTGYRAVHLTVRKSGRLIEAQIRTHYQHGWAELIEALDRRSEWGPDVDLKHGVGPEPVIAWYRRLAELIDAAGRGIIIEEEELQGLSEQEAMLNEFRPD
jgi:ppGpp synthetase/RelA/SpoT-type nucleotidyltranferase